MFWLSFLYFATAAKAMDYFTRTPCEPETICLATETDTAANGHCEEQDQDNYYGNKHIRGDAVA